MANLKIESKEELKVLKEALKIFRDNVSWCPAWDPAAYGETAEQHRKRNARIQRKCDRERPVLLELIRRVKKVTMK